MMMSGAVQYSQAPKVYGQEERTWFRSLFLSHRQKVMRELLYKKGDVILQPQDLKKWKSKKRVADYSFYAILLNIPMDLYALFYLRGKA